MNDFYDPKAEPWDDDPRPRCPNCGMRMIANIVGAIRIFECLRCGHSQNDERA